jgi:pimeloyl-ACP methyl ester carboxylesterase
MTAVRNKTAFRLRAAFFLLFLLQAIPGLSQSDTCIYLFPGQGSDYRIFKNLSFPKTTDTVCINYPEPFDGERLPEYSERIAAQIDTSSSCIFMGVSMGGMICTELADGLNPHKIIIISSAKTRDELPLHYRFQKHIPINRLVPPPVVKFGALILQPVVEPDRNTDKDCFKRMLSAKTPIYLKRTADMIINWERKCSAETIIHIHGNNDRTLPIRNIKADYIITGGSHMMTLTRAVDLQIILDEIW